MKLSKEQIEAMAGWIRSGMRSPLPPIPSPPPPEPEPMPTDPVIVLADAMARLINWQHERMQYKDNQRISAIQRAASVGENSH